jgi:hypothetical protein
MIPVYRKGRKVGSARVDPEHLAELDRYLWQVDNKGYVSRYEQGRGTIYMAREIVGLEHGDRRQVDHRNGDRLDNQTHNLRIVTPGQNQQNRQSGNRGAASRYRGVFPCKQTGRWQARVTLNGVNHWLGRHDTEEEAARVAREFRLKHMTHNDADRTAEPDHQSLYRIREPHA